MPNSTEMFLEETSWSEIKVDDEFWNKRLQTNQHITLKHIYQMLESTGRIANFLKASGRIEGEYKGMYFNDSDVYKWLEAASYVLAKNDDDFLKNKINEVIAFISEAQEDNGYINTYFILEEPEKKWTNLGMMHELYCAGHLIQAAVANYCYLGDDQLIKVATKFADHIDETFRQAGKRGIPGHEEIELALISLYRMTGKNKYLDLAEHFIVNRGQKSSPIKEELNKLASIAGSELTKDIENYGEVKIRNLFRELFMDDTKNYDGRYAQDHLPACRQTTAEGHAVRAVYFYSGIADLVLEKRNPRYAEILKVLWNDMVEKKIYVTGSIGSDSKIEGFAGDYELPNRKAYAETCASVGNIFWNQRLLKLFKDGKYGDLKELILYNGFLAGVSLSGNKFFYKNPLESDGSHDRKEWFEVACCPPNIARLLASLEKYIYFISDDQIYIDQYISSKLETIFNNKTVELKLKSYFPWEGKVEIIIDPKEKSNFGLNLRKPGWCSKINLAVNDDNLKVDRYLENGFIKIAREWHQGDSVKLNFQMEIKKLRAHPEIKNNAGKLALKRGPVVYCIEEVDNEVPLHKIFLTENDKFEFEYKPGLLSGTGIIRGKARVPKNEKWMGELYQDADLINYKMQDFIAVPYHLWSHRASGEMRVWINKF